MRIRHRAQAAKVKEGLKYGRKNSSCQYRRAGIRNAPDHQGHKADRRALRGLGKPGREADEGNQPILVHNLKHPEDKKPELTAEEVELLTSPMELTDYKDAIMEAMYRGTKRNIESELEGKNTAAG